MTGSGALTIPFVTFGTAGVIFELGSSVTTVTITGATVLNGAGTVTIQSAGANAVLNGGVSGIGALTFTRTAGTPTLSGSSLAPTAGLTIGAGAVLAGQVNTALTVSGTINGATLFGSNPLTLSGATITAITFSAFTGSTSTFARSYHTIASLLPAAVLRAACNL